VNWIDLGIIGTVLVPGLIGLKTGLVRAVFTLVGVGLGFYFAMQYYATLAPLIRSFVSDDSIANAGGFGLILIGSILVAWVLASFAKKVLSAIFLGWVDNVGGALLGAVIGSILASIVLLILPLVPGLEEVVAGSTFAPFFTQVIPSLLSSDARSFLPL
jgi:uncharacterized membrane protein required for colicin V production